MPGKRAPSAQVIGSLVGTRDGVNTMAKRKIPALAGNQTPAVQPIA